MHKTQVFPKDQFKRKMERRLAGAETESWERLCFKLDESELRVTEESMEPRALVPGID
jgi:hypothetical protein